jgi:general stress protein 26
MEQAGQQQCIRAFIAANNHGTLATVSKDGAPEAAIIEYAETDALEILFGTSVEYRKYENLMQNPRVAFTVGNKENSIGLQYEGDAHLISEDQLAHYKEIYFTKCPDAKRFDAVPGHVFFKISPRWMRFRDLTTVPPTEFEQT